MNEKTAKKIGEAYAFAQVLEDTASKVPGVVQELFGDYASDIASVTASQKSGLDGALEGTDFLDVVHQKADKTVTKIATMADTYVGDEWDNPVEVLEWMSFFVGAALVHWQLILGSGKELGHEKLTTATQEGVTYYENLLSEIRKTAERIGHERAQAE